MSHLRRELELKKEDETKIRKQDLDTVGDVSQDVAAQQQLANQMGQNPGTSNKGGENTESTDTDTQIDNPYLRPIKMPKFKLGKKSKY